MALLVAGFVVSSLDNLLTGLAWAVTAAFATQFVRGFGIAAMDMAANTLVQRSVDPRMLGRVFGNLYGAIGVAAALSYVAGGHLLDATSQPHHPHSHWRGRNLGHPHRGPDPPIRPPQDPLPGPDDHREIRR